MEWESIGKSKNDVDNVSSLDINASDFINNDSLRSRNDDSRLEDGNRMPEKPKLNFNRLDTIHIDLRPKTKAPNPGPPKQPEVALLREVMPEKKHPSFKEFKQGGPNKEVSKPNDVRPVEFEVHEPSYNNEMENGLKKGLTFEDIEKKSLSTESEFGMGDTISSRWNVSVQYADRKAASKEDGQRVTKKQAPQHAQAPRDATPPKTSNLVAPIKSTSDSPQKKSQPQSIEPKPSPEKNMSPKRVETQSIDLGDQNPYLESKTECL